MPAQVHSLQLVLNAPEACQPPLMVCPDGGSRRERPELYATLDPEQAREDFEFQA